MRRLVHGLSIAILCAGSFGCSPDSRLFNPETNDYHDQHLGLSRNDYRNIDNPKAPEGERPPGKPGSTDAGVLLGSGETADGIKTTIETGAPPIPSLSQILATPQPPKIGATQLVSIAVTDDVPLKDVLIELGRLAKVDVELDAGISGGVSFTATDRPFNEVIARVADLAGLRYSMKNNVLRVERDLPYIKNYSLDFLNLVRNTESNVSISTNVLSGGGGGGGSSGGGGGLNTGSSTSVDSSASSDLWSSMEAGIQEIVNYAPANRMSKLETTADESTAGGASGAVGGGATESAAARAPAPAAAPAGGGAGGGATSGLGAGAGRGLNDTFYILNRQAGLLTLSGNDKQQALVQTFLDKMRTNASAQVLIEAKIVEVTLKDSFQSGVNWSGIAEKLGLRVNFGTTAASSTATNIATIKLGESNVARTNGASTPPDISNLISLLNVFGTTRTLSSPRLHAINNQQAVMTVARNAVYFDISIERQQNTGVTDTNQTDDIFNTRVNSEIRTVPIGLIMTMLPSINLDTNEITLNVRPTLTSQVGTVEDPAVAFLAGSIEGASQLKNVIPVVEVRELDSILKLKSGETMVIGGLMQSEASNTEQGVPGVSEAPWVGNMFKSNDKSITNKEMVLFIRATIVNTSSDADSADETLYKKFTRDPRPLKF